VPPEERKPAAAPDPTKLPPEEGFLAFRVAGARLALPLTQVHSLLRPVPVTPVPFTPPTLLGVLSLRGELVPLLDLGPVLGGEPDPDPAGPRVRYLVAEHAGRLRALVVRGAQEVFRGPEEEGEGEGREGAADAPGDLLGPALVAGGERWRRLRPEALGGLLF